MENHRRVCAYVDLDAIQWNLRQIHKGTLEHTKIIAVIKANGYGHGAIPIARKTEKLEFLWGFAVATAEEAYALQDAGIRKPILILGYTFEEDYEEICSRKLIVPVFTYEMAKKMSETAQRQKSVQEVHLVVDTGMTRIGFRDDERAVRECVEISKLPGITITGMFTHFARADEFDSRPAESQLERYQVFADKLEAAGIPLCWRHCSNSAGIMNLPSANLDIVRAGIILYGLLPSQEVYRDRISLRPALTLKSHVVFVKDVEPGTPVSYGGTFVAPRKMRIATIPVGYGDGYPRSLSNKGYVLIHGKQAPIVGRVCMDQFMVDVTCIPGVQVEDVVTLIGKDGEENITVEELGELSGRFNYEFVCNLTPRVPRIYSDTELDSGPE